MKINKCPVCGGSAKYIRHESMSGYYYSINERCGCPHCDLWMNQDIDDGGNMFTVIQAWNEIRTFPRGLLGNHAAREYILNYPYFDRKKYTPRMVFENETVPRWLHSLIDRMGKAWQEDIKRKDKEYEDNDKAWKFYAEALESEYRRLSIMAGEVPLDRVKIATMYRRGNKK